MLSFLKKFFKKSLSLYRVQEEIIDFILSSNAKVIGVEAGTGTGKSVIQAYLSAKVFKEERILISTYTKNLQEQMVETFKKFFPKEKIAVLKGKGNFVCRDKLKLFPEIKKGDYIPKALREKVKVDEYCSSEYRKVCPHRHECEYLKMLEEVKNSRIVITNHFLLPSVQDSFDIIFIDEVHEVDRALLSPKHLDLSFLQPYLKRKYSRLTREEMEEIETVLTQKIQSSKTQQEANLYQSILEKARKIHEEMEKAKVVEVNGRVEYLTSVKIEFENAKKVIYLSATFPDQFYSIPEPEDFMSVDPKTLENVTVEILDTEYRKKDYYRKVKKAILKLKEKHGRVMVLATSKEQLKKLKSLIPEIQTTLELPVQELVRKFKEGEVKIIAGTDMLWTGVDVPGEKGILITKLPFEPPERVLLFPDAYKVMITRAKTKFKQGLGRMKRTPHCSGTIVIADERILDEKFSDFFKILAEMKQKGAILTIPQTNKKLKKAV